MKIILTNGHFVSKTSLLLLVAFWLIGCNAGRNAGQSPDYQAKMTGNYKCVISGGEVDCPGKMSLSKSASGILSGEYEFMEKGSKVSGTLYDFQFIDPQKFKCKWKDKHGTGDLEMSFNKDITEFSGKWNAVGESERFSWNGSKCDAGPGASAGSAPKSATGNTGRDSGRFPDYQALREKAGKLWTGENKASKTYIILIESGSSLMKAARMLAKYRKAEIVNFSPANPEGCLEELIKKKARYVTVFVEPKDMDVNLLRKFIVLSTLLDDDPFCDFALGFVTASSTEEVEKFVTRIVEADQNGVKDFAIGMNMSNVSVKYGDDSFIKGMSGESYFIAEGDLKYAREVIPQLNRAGFIHIGGCADPEGIWMFNDQRNLDESKHWPFDQKKVGWDPKGEMPRITATEFRNLKLSNAIVWTHACHLGSVSRVFVEGDIVSTFGRCDTVEEYLMPKEKSVALAIIEAGVSAYICPLGPNFGAQASIEQSIAGETGIPLGDVMRRAYHDVVMDTDGHPEKIGIFIKGKPRFWNPDDFTNNDLPQHRCLYGDPLFAPLKGKPSPPTVEIGAEERVDGIALTFRVKASGYLGRTWYGNRGENPGQGRIYEEIPLKKNVQGVSIGEVKTRDALGKEFSIISRTALIEKIDGKTILHIQLVTDNPEALRNAGAIIEVSVKYKD